MPARERYAPSPTGALHLGSAAAAILADAACRSRGGRFVLRIEDIDTPRVQPGAMEAMLDDLRWLGVTWDEGPDVGGAFGPYIQSDRVALYEAALAQLEHRGLTYRCDCSRTEIRAASAPHADDEPPPYPGTCRDLDPQRSFKRPPAIRARVPDAVVTVTDEVFGSFSSNLVNEPGDFVLRRGDGVFAYQLAVVVDDALQGIDRVVRGVDLLSSAPRQRWLQDMLGAPRTRYLHFPLIVMPDGSRLAKRAQSVPIASWREAGRDPEALWRAVARAYGQPAADSSDIRSALRTSFNEKKIPTEPVPLSELLDV